MSLTRPQGRAKMNLLVNQVENTSPYSLAASPAARGGSACHQLPPRVLFFIGIPASSRFDGNPLFLEQKRLNLRAWRCADSRSGKPYRCVSPGVQLGTTWPSVVKKETAVPSGGFRGARSFCGAVSFFKEPAPPVWFEMMKFGSVIPSGGRSLRMGGDKAKLKIDGMCFPDRIAEELPGFDELLMSADKPAR